MPSERDDRATLLDMLAFAREALELARGRTRKELDHDRALLRSLERMFELLGECARRLSDETKRLYPSISWRKIIGMRNIIAHEYGRIDPDEIWATADRDLPHLVVALESIAATLTKTR